MKSASATVALCTAVLAAPAAEAADIAVDAPPLYGTYSLTGGFSPDPMAIDLEAGGMEEAGPLGPDCAGFINAENPDVALDFSHATKPLRLYVISGADTSLAVHQPNGQWRCNDDANDVNPLVTIAKPAPGRYGIWVGVHDSEAFQQATLYVTEGEPDWSAGAAPALVADAPPRAGLLQVGAADLPVVLSTTAVGGDADASIEGPGCAGAITTSAPDVRLVLDDAVQDLTLALATPADTTLLVLQPDGSVLCNDDADGTDPAVHIPEAQAGTYAVWFGLLSGDGEVPAALSVGTGQPDWMGLRAGLPAASPSEEAPSPLRSLDLTGLTAFQAMQALAKSDGGGTLRFDSGEAIGEEGFELRGVTIADPESPDDQPLTMASLRVEQVDMAAMRAGKAPDYLTLSIRGLDVPEEALKSGEDIAPFQGIEDAKLDVDLAYRADTATGKLDVQTIRVALPGLLAIDLGLSIDGYQNLPLNDMEQAPLLAMTLSLAKASLTIEDKSYLKRMLDAEAERQGKTPDAILAQWLDEISSAPDAVEGAAGTESQALLAVVQNFVRGAAEKGSGTLRLRMDPAQPLSPLALMMSPQTPAEKLAQAKVTAVYEP